MYIIVCCIIMQELSIYILYALLMPYEFTYTHPGLFLRHVYQLGLTRSFKLLGIVKTDRPDSNAHSSHTHAA